MPEPAEKIIGRLAAQRQELQAEITRLETAAQERDGLASEVEKLKGHLGQVHEDIVAATRREGRLYDALEKSWAPPAHEPLTETELNLAKLQDGGPTAGMYDAPEPDWGTPAHIDQLPTYQRAPRQEAPQPPPSPTRPRASTPTLKLEE